MTVTCRQRDWSWVLVCRATSTCWIVKKRACRPAAVARSTWCRALATWRWWPVDRTASSIASCGGNCNREQDHAQGNAAGLHPDRSNDSGGDHRHPGGDRLAVLSGTCAPDPARRSLGVATGECPVAGAALHPPWQL